MKVLGYVNRFSRGVYRVQKELEENGNGQASFDFSLITAFRVVENVSQKYFEESFGGETAQEKHRKDPRKAQERPKKSPRNIEDEILDEIKDFPQVTRKDLAKRLNRTEDSIRYYLRRMVKEGVIKHEGSTKAGKWIIIK